MPNLPTDSTKKLPTVGGEGSKICESCRRLKWMVPYFKKASQGKKKVSLTVHVRFLSINLQYLIFTFGGFTRMRKSVKSAACVFFTPVTMR